MDFNSRRAAAEMSSGTLMLISRETWITENRLQGISSYTVESKRQSCTALLTTEAEYIALLRRKQFGSVVF